MISNYFPEVDCLFFLKQAYQHIQIENVLKSDMYMNVSRIFFNP